MLVVLFIIVGIVGLCLGSFLNVLTVRVASGERFLAARSHCPSCRHVLSFLDLMPVVSFFMLRGRCRYCGWRISWRYPLIELSTAILFIFIIIRHVSAYGLELTAYSLLIIVRDIFFVLGLIALFIFDVVWYIVPDSVSLPVIVVSAVLNLLMGVSLPSRFLGMLVGWGFYLALWFFSQGRWVGSGDIRLGLVLGAMLGYPLVFVALWVAYVAGGVVAVCLLAARRKELSDVLPMGAFLTVGGCVTL